MAAQRTGALAAFNVEYRRSGSRPRSKANSWRTCSRFLDERARIAAARVHPRVARGSIPDIAWRNLIRTVHFRVRQVLS
jgi:hypothetical protein